MKPRSPASAVSARIIKEPVESAREAGLQYISDGKPGIHRKIFGKTFKFFNADGKVISNEDELIRIRRLAIPPAWQEVWICPAANGHLQATGRDAKGRKQHRYHEKWREIRDETKYNRMIAFALLLPQIRKGVEKDLSLTGLPRRKVLAAAVKILETGFIRVGNEEYVKQNNSYGLTTMRDKHAAIRGDTIHFEFKGKSGKYHNVQIQDKRLAHIVKSCQDIPGQELFQYIDDDKKRHAISSGDVNEYIREISGGDYTAKDFRTWAGTVLAAIALREFAKFDSQTQAKRNIVHAIKNVAEQLGNTPTICKKCYVHPAIINSYMDGTVVQVQQQRAEKELQRKLHTLQPEEAAVLALLQQKFKADFKQRSTTLIDQLESSLNHRRATGRPKRKSPLGKS